MIGFDDDEIEIQQGSRWRYVLVNADVFVVLVFLVIAGIVALWAVFAGLGLLFRAMTGESLSW